MLELPPILVAGITGLISGLLLSIPVGPINLTILNEGAQRGFKWAALIGLGATVMEVIYCFIAFTSFASFFNKGYVKPAMKLFSFVFMSYIGIKFVLAKSVQKRPVFAAAGYASVRDGRVAVGGYFAEPHRRPRHAALASALRSERNGTDMPGAAGCAALRSAGAIGGAARFRDAAP